MENGRKQFESLSETLSESMSETLSAHFTGIVRGRLPVRFFRVLAGIRTCLHAIVRICMFVFRNPAPQAGGRMWRRLYDFAWFSTLEIYTNACGLRIPSSFPGTSLPDRLAIPHRTAPGNHHVQSMGFLVCLNDRISLFCHHVGPSCEKLSLSF